MHVSNVRVVHLIASSQPLTHRVPCHWHFSAKFSAVRDMFAVGQRASSRKRFLARFYHRQPYGEHFVQPSELENPELFCKYSVKTRGTRELTLQRTSRNFYAMSG